MVRLCTLKSCWDGADAAQQHGRGRAGQGACAPCTRYLQQQLAYQCVLSLDIQTLHHIFHREPVVTVVMRTLRTWQAHLGSDQMKVYLGALKCLRLIK